MTKVLVVDDEPDVEALIPQIFRSRIRKGELAFEFAENGAIALQKLKADAAFDLIFTDINMPVMDGLTLLAKLKEHELIQKAVVISAYGDLKNIRTAMNRGAFDFITKPIDFEDIEATLMKAIREMEILRQGLEARSNLEKALIEKAEAQQDALLHLQEKEQLILSQNEMLEQQVKERTIEVIHQKELVEVKNKEILDSIHYAKRLQDASLPSSEYIKTFLPESFILFQPKDIVSGDFYWLGSTGDLIIIVAADCTGHGVAGALMSMLGISLLNQIVNERGITSPSLILDQLDSLVTSALKKNANESHAGMDIAICNIDFKKKQLQYSGANRPLWIIRGNEIEIIKADRFSIGGLNIGLRQPTLNERSLNKNEMLYIFTDGFADQFGGEYGKKLMSKNFMNLLLSIREKDCDEQNEFLKNYFEKWKGDNEQVDDILVIGFRS
jgi:sigma-B regulation protein RsbU (phosphoserine phosphatase)